jgi:hypothetical protein
MDTAGRSPRPVRRPMRVALAPSTAYLLQQLLDLERESNEAYLRGRGRQLGLDAQLDLETDLEDLRYGGGWYRAHSMSDVGQTDTVRSDIARGSSHEDEMPTAEAARELGVTPRTVLRLVDQQQLVGRRVNARQTMVTRASVKALREARGAVA